MEDFLKYLTQITLSGAAFSFVIGLITAKAVGLTTLVCSNLAISLEFDEMLSFILLTWQ